MRQIPARARRCEGSSGYRVGIEVDPPTIWNHIISPVPRTARPPPSWAQGCAVADAADLLKMFENGDNRTRVAQATRHPGTLHPSGDTAEFPQDDRTAAAGLPDHEFVGP